MQDARQALETGNANIALQWVHPDGEDEVRAAFDDARAARGENGAERAERQFLETLVRVHRAGEGAGFDGIKPTGTDLPPEVVAADTALEAGTIDPLRGLIPEERWSELEKRFAVVLAKKGFDVDDRLRRGAVVAVDSRELGRRIVKRIVGLPGEHLRLEGSELWVDERPLAEP